MKNSRETGALLILALSVLFIFFLKAIDFTPLNRDVAPESGALLNAAPPATVDLNTATIDELKKLPGIGDALAARIIERRQELGAKGFKSVEDLTSVRGIGEVKLQRMRGMVTLGSGEADETGEVEANRPNVEHKVARLP